MLKVSCPNISEGKFSFFVLTTVCIVKQREYCTSAQYTFCVEHNSKQKLVILLVATVLKITSNVLRRYLMEKADRVSENENLSQRNKLKFVVARYLFIYFLIFLPLESSDCRAALDLNIFQVLMKSKYQKLRKTNALLGLTWSRYHQLMLLLLLHIQYRFSDRKDKQTQRKNRSSNTRCSQK